MKLSLGIVGLPNVGKSTLFKLLTRQDILVANYPFATIDPNVGVVPVPDERLQKLGALSNSKKIIPAVVEFYDIAGLVKGASTGEGLGNQFLSHIRDVQAVVLVLRVFPDPSIIHVENSVDSLRDLDIIHTELILKDIDVVTKRLDKAEKEAKSGDKKAMRQVEVLQKVRETLSRGELASSFGEEEMIKELQLLTAKKQLYLLNGAATDVPENLLKKIEGWGGEYVVMNLVGEVDMTPLIEKAYKILNLISFLTTGEEETRAWTITAGTRAPRAAGVIHTDFEKKFIRAEVIYWTELLASASWSKAKQKGLIRLEGKEYIVRDGDVLVIRHG